MFLIKRLIFNLPTHTVEPVRTTTQILEIIQMGQEASRLIAGHRKDIEAFMPGETGKNKGGQHDSGSRDDSSSSSQQQEAHSSSRSSWPQHAQHPGVADVLSRLKTFEAKINPYRHQKPEREILMNMEALANVMEAPRGVQSRAPARLCVDI